MPLTPFGKKRSYGLGFPTSLGPSVQTRKALAPSGLRSLCQSVAETALLFPGKLALEPSLRGVRHNGIRPVAIDALKSAWAFAARLKQEAFRLVAAGADGRGLARHGPAKLVPSQKDMKFLFCSAKLS